MPDNDSTRRRVLQVAGATAVVALAGCSNLGSGADSTDGESSGGESADSMDEGADGASTSDDSMGDESMDEETMDNESTEQGSMETGMEPTDPADAPRATVDRFSDDAGTLHVRESGTDLPEPGEPIDFDATFLTTGFGPGGEVVQYYDFDVQATTPAPIYAFFDADGEPVEGQLNVVGTVPGDEGYNDFWQVQRVTVPDGYEANTVTSVEALMDAGYAVEPTSVVKNCPVVPEGSTASMRYGDGTAGLVEGWYDGQVVSYFLFEEAPLEVTDGSVPLSPIYVTFNENPGQDGGGPPSGFVTEADSDRTHNVVATLPGDEDYSPLWLVNVYDNADFESVSDLESATGANILASGVANVNCPVVSVN